MSSGYLFAYKPASPEQEAKDAEAILAAFDPVSARRLLPGIWILLSGPNCDTVHDRVRRMLQFPSSMPSLVSSIQEPCDLSPVGMDRDVEKWIRDVFRYPLSLRNGDEC